MSTESAEHLINVKDKEFNKDVEFSKEREIS